MSDSDRPNYGVDAPTVVRNLAIGGVVCLIAGISWQPLRGLIVTAISLLATSGLMLWGSRVWKLRLRDRLLDSIPWRGDERVLDVGCGSGLMLLGAAKRLTTGKAIGIDVWSQKDQSGNSSERTLANARAEGVAERIELQTADARQMPFADESFDVILSNWVLHNIHARAEREKALREMTRVLRPGGRLIIVDILHSGQYAVALREAGLSDVSRSRPNFIFGIPTRVVRASKK